MATKFSRVLTSEAERYLVSGAARSMGTRMVGLLLGFASQVMLSRLLGISDFGLYSLILGWVLLLSAFAKVGVDFTILKFGSIYFSENRWDRLGKLMRYALCAIAISVAVIGLVLVTGTAIVPGVFGAVTVGQSVWILVLLSSLVWIGIFSLFFRAAKMIILSQLFEQVIRSAILIAILAVPLMLHWQISVRDALAATAVASIFAGTVMLIVLVRTFPRPRVRDPGPSALREWIAVSWPLYAMSLLQQCTNQLPLILLGYMATRGEVAWLAASARLAALAPLVTIALNLVSAPLIATAWSRGDRAELLRIATISARLSFAATFAISACLVMFGPTALAVFGNEFEGAYPALIILLGGGLINAATGLSGYFMSMTNLQREAMWVAAISLVLTAAVAAALIPVFGAVGAACGGAFATAIQNILWHQWIWRAHRIDTSVIGYVSVPPARQQTLAG